MSEDAERHPKWLSLLWKTEIIRSVRDTKLEWLKFRDDRPMAVQESATSSSFIQKNDGRLSDTNFSWSNPYKNLLLMT